MKRTGTPFFNEEQEKLIREHLLKGAPEFEVERFLITCERTGLDPFSRQIYGRLQNTKVKGRNGQPDSWTKSVVIITSIDGFRAIAERSGEYAGQTPPEWFYLNSETNKSEWQDVFFAKRDSSGNLLTTLDACRVGVKRKGWDTPVFGVANFDSFAVYEKGDNGWFLGKFWNKMPEHMIAKVAEAQAFRKAFPLLAQGLYVEEEIRSEDEEEHGAPPPKTETLPEGATWIPDQRMIGKVAESRALEAASAPLASSEAPSEAQTPLEPTKPAGEAAAEPKTRKPRAPKPAPAKPAPEQKPEAGPFGEEEAKPATPAPVAKPSTGGWVDHVITQITLAEFSGKKLGELTADQIEFLYTGWVLKYAEKRAATADPEKKAIKNKEAAMITEAQKALGGAL